MRNTLIASCNTTAGELIVKSGGKANQMNSDVNKTTLGELKVVKCESKTIPSFSEYIKSGFKISLVGAIDFTYSNGTASNPTSLHYVNSTGKSSN